MIYNYIHENIDSFYDNENLRNKFLKKHKVDKGDHQGLVNARNLYHQKMALKEMLMTWAENKVILRRNRIREKHINCLLRNTNKNLDYRQKSAFIESEIETDILFFKANTTAFSDLKVKYDFNYATIVKKLRKNNLIIEKMQKKKAEQRNN